MRPIASTGASTAMKGPPGLARRRSRPAGSRSPAPPARRVPIVTTWISHTLNAGQVKAARPRRGQGAGGCGRPPRAAVDPVALRSCSSVAGRTPCSGSRCAGSDRPSPRAIANPAIVHRDVAGSSGQPESEREAQREVGGMVHQVVEVDAVQADRSAPAGDLAVDVVEPEAQVGQHDADDEQGAIAGADRNAAARATTRARARSPGGRSSPSRIASQQP